MAVGPGPELYAIAPSVTATVWRWRWWRGRGWWQRVGEQFTGAQDERWHAQSQSPPSPPFTVASPTVRSPSVQPVGRRRGRGTGRLPARFRLAQGHRGRTGYRNGRIQSRSVLSGSAVIYRTAALSQRPQRKPSNLKTFEILFIIIITINHRHIIIYNMDCASREKPKSAVE